MFKKALAILCALLLAFPVTAITVGATETSILKLSFTDADITALEANGSTIVGNENAETEIVKDIVSQDNDGAAIKGTHIGDNYSATPSGIRLTFGTPLPVGGEYKFSVWFYVPSEGNKEVPGKKDLIGPSLLINGNSGSDDYKYPTTATEAGTVTYDTWINVALTPPALPETIDFLDMRFYTNEGPTHPEVWYIDNIEIVQLGAQEVEIPEWDLTLDALQDSYKDKFLFGNIMESRQVTDDATVEMYKTHYNVVTAENDMKPMYMSPSKGTYNFTNADTLVEWAIENNLVVHGHTLVWHSQSADWLTKNTDGSPLTRAEAKANMEDYIKNVAGHYAGKLISWDVVNEAFSDGATGSWKDVLRKSDSPWYMAYDNGADASKGESASDYIYDAFVLARQYDPNATLYYNDYNEHNVDKCGAIASMVKELNEQWKADPAYDGRMLIEGIGLQSHYFTDELSSSVSAIETTIKTLLTTGAKLSVSELDLPIGSYSNYNVRTEPPTEKELATQAKIYAELLQLYVKYADDIERVTIWGKADSQSWRAGGHPLLFDRTFKPKVAYAAVLDPVAYLNPESIEIISTPEPSAEETSTPEPSAPVASTPEPSDDVAGDEDSGSGSSVITVGIAVVVVAAVAGGVLMAVRKKK